MSEKLDPQRMPRHIAIIMDGNGRWAKARGLPRTKGHLEGTKRVEEIIVHAGSLGLQALTLFTFSTENWNRPRAEVTMLMNTLASVLNKKVADLKKKNVMFRTIGRVDRLPRPVLEAISKAKEATKDNTGLILNIALDYGAQEEIIQAIKLLADAVREGRLTTSDITEKKFSQFLYTDGLPDPDLLIRTSGEKRISNFLLWQLSYSELYFTEKYWPDFNQKELEKAILDYQQRDRRFGKINER